MQRRQWSWFFLLGFAVSACDFHVDYQTNSEKIVNREALPLTATIDWNLMRTVVLHDCADCHNGRTPPLLFELPEMQQNIQRVWDMASRGAMPPQQDPYTSLSSCWVAALKKWIELGTPDTSSTKVSVLPECVSVAPNPPIDDLPLNYQTLKSKILDPRCSKCHCPESDCQANLVLFEPYGNLENDPQTRWSSPASQSRVIRALTRADKFRMPPPGDSDPLPVDYIDFITRWIDAGRPEF